MSDTIVFLDDDADLREAFVELFATLGERCIAVESVAELIRRGADVLAAKLVILDVNLGPGQPSGVDALEWLRSQGFAGRVVFLTGHADTHPLVREARDRGCTLLRKPVRFEELEELVPHAAM
jgi:FixJ family two-component response regulator